MRVAILLTCHNRRAKTIACLRTICVFLPEASIYLTDDGCTDGTREMVEKEFPQVNIVNGDGTLFWCRGMYYAWRESSKKDFDYYLWLNDDTIVYQDFFAEMLEICQMNQERCIVCGLVEDASKSEILYGGVDKAKHRVLATGKAEQIYWMNGNVVLVPRQIVQTIGFLDPYYIHDLGDVDYGLMAQKAGFQVLSTRKAIAQGSHNAPCRVRRWDVGLVKRFKVLNAPLGSPLAQNFHFRKKHYGFFSALAFVSHLVLLNLLPDWAVEMISGDKYKDKIHENE